MKSLFLCWKPSHISEWFDSGKAVDVLSENALYFNFLVSCLYTFNLLLLLLKWVTTLAATTYRNMESRQSCRANYMMRVNESDRGPFLIFRWNNVLHDSYQADEVVIEIEEWKQKVPVICIKSFSRFLLSVLEISVVS